LKTIKKTSKNIFLKIKSFQTFNQPYLRLTKNVQSKKKSINMQIIESKSTLTNNNTDIQASNNNNLKFLVLQPQGGFDMQYGKVLEKQMADLIPQNYYFLVIDLGQVNFMDTSVLSALMSGFSAARSSNCRLVICNLQASIRMIFELT
jgi:anti-sigma B factor antagonist